MTAAIGVFGGSFDPIHLGHLWMAEAALQQLPIDQVRWIPTATSPLKQDGPVATNTQRLRMLQLALSGNAGHVIDTREFDRDGLSYTVETLQQLRSEHPEQPIYLIIGADSLLTFDAWKDPAKILKLSTLAVVARGGMPAPNYEILRPFASAETIEACRQAEIKMPAIEISSSDLRARVASSQSIRFHVPHPVEAYIRHEQLYAPANRG